jgi:hypothetical protein
MPTKKGASNTVKAVSFREYVKEILNTAGYQPCEDGSGFVAVADALPGCMAQGKTFQGTRNCLSALSKRGLYPPTLKWLSP